MLDNNSQILKRKKKIKNATKLFFLNANNNKVTVRE